VGSVRGRALAVVLNVCACGARSGIEREALDWTPWDAGAEPVVNLDASVDRVLDRPARIEAGCDGEALPAPRSVAAARGPTRLYPVVLHDPTRRRALVLGGLPSSGMFSRAVFAISTEDGAVRPLGESPVDLAISAHAVWIDPGRTALIVAGALPGGTWTSRVLRVDVTDDALRFSVVGEHPGGASSGVTAVFDGARRAVIVHGGSGIDTADPRPFGVTWALRLEGDRARWSELVAGAESPPAASGRVGGIDPRTGALVLLSGLTREGYDRRVWRLSAGERPRWTQLSGAADVVARSGDALEWDPVGCGFVVVGGRCADQAWLVRPEATGVREALLGTMRVDGVTSGLGRESAAVVFDPAQRALMVIAGSDCTVNGATIASNVRVELR
jgi:hypothetical protein